MVQKLNIKKSSPTPVKASASGARKVDLAKRLNPLYSQYLPKWNFYLESVKGGQDYTTSEENLFTHRLESVIDDYEDRKSRAYYLNYCAAVPVIYADYIFKEPVSRPADNKLMEFRQDVDGKGTPIEAFMRKVSILASIFGHIHIVVDTPVATNVVTKAQAQEQNIRPYATLVYPMQVKDWSMDSSGKLNWVLIEEKSYEDADPLIERIDVTNYKIIYRDRWELYDKDSNKIGGGPNPLGEVFMTTCYNKDIDLDMIGESILCDIAYINRAIFNWCSNIDEMIERQTFSQLTCPDDGSLSERDESTNPLKKIGTSTIFTFPSDTGHPPAFISPDTSQISVIWTMIGQHVQEIWRLAGLKGNEDGFAMSQRSGVSMQMAFLDINSALAAKATSLEVAENDLTRLAARWSSQNETPAKVNYPTNFDVLTLTESITTTFQLVDRNISVVLNKQLMKQLVRKALPLIDEELKVEIEGEIDASDGNFQSLQEIAQIEALENPNPPGGGGGSTNTSSKNQAVKSKQTKAKGK